MCHGDAKRFFCSVHIKDQLIAKGWGGSIKEAEKDGLFMLKGHRTAGGMRASLYNSIKIDETERLISFLEKFEDKYNYN